MKIPEITIDKMEYDWSENKLYNKKTDMFEDPDDEQLETLLAILKNHYTKIKIITLLLESE